jgi:hypothetical protein
VIKSSVSPAHRSEPAAGSRWLIYPHLIVRMAGFPIEMLDELVPRGMRARLRELEDAAVDLRTRRGALLGLLGELRRQAITPAAVAQVRRIERDVRRNRATAGSPPQHDLSVRLDEWNRAVERLDECVSTCWESRVSAETEISAALTELAANRPFMEAVFVNSPSAFEGIVDYRSSRRADQRRLITGYLQRFTTKAETASFFGPSNFIRANDTGTGGIAFTARKAGVEARRHVSISYWAAQAIANSLRSRNSISGHLRLYRNAALSRTTTPQPGSTPIEATILRAADGSLSISHLAASLALPVEQVEACVSTLERRGLLTRDLKVPTACPEPLAALRDLVKSEDLDEDSTKLLDFFDTWRLGFEQGDLENRRRLLQAGERRFEQATGLAGRRAAGKFYGDRFLYVEEASGNLSGGEVGRRFLDELAARLGPAIDVVASEAIEVRLLGRRQLLSAQSGRTEALAELLQAPHKSMLAEVRRVRMNHWKRLVPNPSARIVRFSRAALKEHGLIRDDLADWPLFCAPDVMFTASAEDLTIGRLDQVILAEVHHILPPLSLPFRYLQGLPEEDLRELVSEIESAFGGTRLMLQAVERETKAMDYTPLGMASLCIDYVRQAAGAETVAVGAATLGQTTGAQPAVASDGVLHYLLPQYDEFLPNPGVLGEAAVPGLDKGPVELGKHTPRIVIEDVVYQRERWIFDREEFDFVTSRRERDLLSMLWQFKASNGLPDAIYAKVDTEDKPFFVDWASPDLCLHLAARLRRATRLIATEALPAPPDLWLHTDSGSHCCELRLTLYRGLRGDPQDRGR